MSWPTWPVAGAPQLTGLTSSVINPLVNSAPPVLPTGSQYTPEQWTQMQQQNWQQWAQWQQQYQQWHQQYGAEFQKSMSAITGSQVPVPTVPMAVAPPLPAEAKPPPPPAEPPSEPTINTTPSNYNTAPNYPPPPAPSEAPTNPMQQTTPGPVPPNFNQGYQTQNWQAQDPSYNNRGNMPTNKRSFGPGNDYNEQAKRPMMDNSWNANRTQGPNQWNHPPPNIGPPKATPAENQFNQPPPVIPKAPAVEELSEAEKKFDKQFADWEAQFNRWKDQNVSHPDKTQYREYEKKWETWRAQLLERREQMRRKRLGITGTSPVPKTTAPSIQTLPAQANPNFSQAPPGFQKPVVGDKRTALLPTPGTNMAQTSDQQHTSFDKPPPHLNDEPLSFGGNSAGLMEEHIEGNDFLKTSSSGGIPGLDLVKDDEDTENGGETTENKSEIIELDADEQTVAKKGADLEALSKGINSILGDQKLLSMLSMVSQNQNIPSTNLTDTTSKISDQLGNVNVPPPPILPTDHSNMSCEGSNQGDYQPPNNQRDLVNNFDDQTRSSFTAGYNDGDRFNQTDPSRNLNNRFGGADQPINQFSTGPPSFGNNNFNRNEFGPGPFSGAPNRNSFPPGPGGANRTDFGPGGFNRMADFPPIGGPNRNEFGPGGPIRGEFGPGGPNRSEFGPGGPNRNDFGPGAPNKNEFGPGGPNRNEFGAGVPNSNDFGLGGPIKKDLGPGSLNRNDFGPAGPVKNDFGFGGPNRINFGPGAPNRSSFGSTELNRNDFVPGAPNRSSFGSTEPNRNDFGPGAPNRSSFGSTEPNRNDFGPGVPNRSSFGSTESNRNDFGLGAPNRSSFGSTESNKNEFAGPNLGVGLKRNEFAAGPNKADFDLKRNDFGPNRNEFGPNRNEFGPNRNEFGPNRNEFGPNRNDNVGPGRFNSNKQMSGNFEQDNWNDNKFGRNDNRFSESYDDYNQDEEDYGGEENFDNFEDDKRYEEWAEEDFEDPNAHKYNQSGSSFRPGNKFPDRSIPPPLMGTKIQPPQGFGMKEPPHGFGMKEPPRGFGMKDPPHGFGITEPPRGFGMKEPPHGFGMKEPPHGFGMKEPPHGFGMKEPPHGFGMNEPPHGFGMKEPLMEPVREPTPQPEEEPEEAVINITDVIDYDHKPLKQEEVDVSIEPLHMFDYRHKQLNRIPYPQRPKWLFDVVKGVMQFEPLVARFDMPPRRFEPAPWKADDFRRPNEYRKVHKGLDRRDGSPPQDKLFFEPPPDIRGHRDDKRRDSRRHDDGDNLFSRGRHRHEDARERNREGWTDYKRDERSEDRGNRFERSRDDSDRDRDRERSPVKRNWEDRRNDRNWEDHDRDNRKSSDRNWENPDDRDNKRSSLDRNWEDRDRSERGHREFERGGKNRSRDRSRDRSRESFERNSGSRNKESESTEQFKNIVVDKINATKNISVNNVTMIQDLLSPPGRFDRPARIVIILRGPPGSGKSFLAKLIKDKEVENGGSAPRILCLDDYFMVEQEKEAVEDGKKVKLKEMVYEYEECMEESYRTSLMKSFKKTITDGYFPFIIVDNVNDKVKYFGEMWSFAKQNGFQVYICQLDLDVQLCSKRNIHNRNEADIKKCVDGWETTPPHHPILDATSLVQSGSIEEVEMEEINSPVSDTNIDKLAEDEVTSKWDNFDCSIGNLARLDGVSKPLRPSRTMEEYLQLDDEWTPSKPTKPGQKRVRWADLEECKQQEKMRAIGFVVGQTNWNRMMDPTMGSNALTQTKYIERTGRY